MFGEGYLHQTPFQAGYLLTSFTPICNSERCWTHHHGGREAGSKLSVAGSRPARLALESLFNQYTILPLKIM